MKKNVLALSITAALVGLTGGAHAMTGALDGFGSVPVATLDALGAASAASSLRLNGDGIGHSLIVPYFTTQNTNTTLINLVNTDRIRGKAVKVRFRGASNSDDLFDFQVFLSPGDVWSASIGRAADGRSQLTTNDASCTKPAKSVLNSTAFLTTRLDTVLTADQKANGTREGYVEIFNMGDIPPVGIAAAALVGDIDATQFTAGVGNAVNPLFTAIKHVTKVAPCSGTAWTQLDTTNLQWSAAAPVAPALNPRSAGLLPPTTGLMANWTVINVASAGAWSGEAVAVQATLTAAPFTPVTGNVVYWPQTGDNVGLANIDFYSADPLLRTAKVAKFDGAAYVADATPGVTAGFYDLPDMSTPYVVAGAVADNPLAQAESLTNSIAASSVTNEFLTDTAITASTDWVFSQPTRRYSVAFDYNATIAATDDGRRFSDIVSKVGGAGGWTNGWFVQQNTLATSATNGNGRQICAKNITVTPFDREETGVATTTTVVVSPSTPADPLSFCGEATVLSINNGGILAAGTSSLKASVAVKDLDVTFRDGWMRIATPAGAFGGAGMTVNGLPMVGAAFERAFAGTQSFGATFNHRMGR